MEIYYKIVTRLEDLPQFDPNEPVFADVETGDLYTDTRLVQLIQVSDKPYGEDNPVIIFDLAPTISDIPNLKHSLEVLKAYLKPLWLVFYNASYDLGTMNLVPEKVDDLFYLMKTAYPEFQEFGLDKVVSKLREIRGLYDGIDKSAMHKRGFSPGAYISKLMYKYSAIDIVALTILWNLKKVQLVREHNLAYKVDILSLKYAIEYQQNGLKVPQDIVYEEIEKAKVDVAKMQSQLPVGLNVNSSPQVKKYLGTEGASREVLLRCTHPDAELILKLKKRRKELSYLESINYSEMVTKFNPAGAITGRFTASGGAIPNGFNAQQIPHRFQYLFKQNIGDTAVIGLDYGTLELRVAASLWGIKKMREFFLLGKDLHIEMAIKATGKKLHPDGIIKIKDDEWGKEISKEYITQEDRTHAKALNFGLRNIAQVKDIELLGSLSAVA